MEFTASNGASGGSYEKPKPGNYLGVLIGVAELGTHQGQYGPKRRIMLRWELHRRKGPALGADGDILTIFAMYNSSFDVKSTLRQVVEAHVGRYEDGTKVDPQEWLGSAARLVLKESDDGKYVNVDSVVPLDEEEDEAPERRQATELWELTDAAAAPLWCRWMVERSDEWKARKATPAATRRPVSVPATDDDDDIPF